MSKESFKELRRKAEVQLSEREGQIESLDPADLKSLAHELAVHQVELEIQNEELRLAKLETEKARDRYLNLYDFAPVGYFTLDAHNRIVEANLAGCQLLKIDRKSLMKQSFTKFISPEESEKFYFQRRKVLESDTKQNDELQMHTEDGTPFYAQVISLKVQEESLRLAVIDITERKKVEETLKTSEERYRSIVETSQEGILIGTPDGKIVFANQRMADLLGYSLDEITGKIGLEFIDKDQKELVLQTREELQKGDKIQREFKFRRKDGSVLWTLASVAPQFDDDGQYVTNLVMHTDITERKKAEESFKESEQRLHILLARTPAILWTTDRNLVYTLSIGLGLQALGLQPHEVEGKTMFEVMQTDDPHYPGLATTYKALSGETSSYEIEFQGVYYYAHIEPLRDAQNKIVGTIGISLDITKRKQAEEALAQAKDELENKVKERTEQLQASYDEIMQTQKALKKANKQLKQYANKITQVQEEERKRIAFELHDDTAQYLSILKMQIGALAESGEIQNPKIKERLHLLERDADRAFNDVRRYSHELRPVVLEHQGLVAALEQIAEDFNKLGQLAVDVHVEGMEPELHEEVKLGFFRVAQEALNNTRKHAKASQSKIDVRFNHKQLKMTIGDNGEGFNAKQALKTRGGKGNLGLLSMKERADLINADLKIESEPSKGTKVILKAKI